MPKRKRLHRAKPPAAFIPEHSTNGHVHNNVKVEPDNEFDPMQFESTKMVISRIVLSTVAQNEVDAIKTEDEVEIENSYRPEIHEIAYIMPRNGSRSGEEKVPKEIINRTMGANRKEMKKKKLTNRSKQDALQKIEPLEIMVDGEKMVKCPICNKQATTRHRSEIKNHIRRVHSNENPFACDYCKAAFPLLKALRVHIGYHHRKKKHQCKQCRAVFFEVEHLEMHQFKCVKTRTFECYLCPFKARRPFMYLYKKHMRKKHTGEQIFDCTFCTEKFVTNERKMKHIRQFHPETMPFECSMCSLKFHEKKIHQIHEKYCQTKRRYECHVCQYANPRMSFEQLKMHMRKHSGEKPFPCYLCDKSYPSQFALTEHLQRHRETFKFKCEQCHRVFLDDNKLAEHQKNCQKRRYECHLCGFTKYGMSFSKFKRHMAKHTGQQILKCNGCPETSGTYIALADHISNSDHSHLLATICPNCCLRFPSRADRNAHQSKCPRKRVECYLCGKTVKTLKQLETHMIPKHTGLKRFNCKICLRKFQFKSNLKIHTKTHTKIGLIKCQYCTRKFVDIRYKKKHENFCKQIYECYLCRKRFPSFEVLRNKHMKTHFGRYQCKHCPKSSVSPRCYGIHVIDNHLHLYKFECKICKGIIKRRKDLRKHQISCMKPERKVKGVIYFECSLCGTGLARLPQLKRHILFGECKNHPKE